MDRVKFKQCFHSSSLAATVDSLREDVTASSWFYDFQRDMRASVAQAWQVGWIIMMLYGWIVKTLLLMSNPVAGLPVSASGHNLWFATMYSHIMSI